MKKFAICCALAAALLGEEPEPHWRVLNHTAREAIQAKDNAKLRATLLELKPLLPGNPRIQYNLAASEAKLGNKAVALTGIRDLARAGLIYDFAADDDFAALRSTPEFAAVVKQVEENKKAISHSATVFALSERDLIPEDIAYDPKTRRFLIASVRQAKIIETDGATTRDFAKTEWPVLALRMDERRGILWAATGWLAHCEHCSAGDKDRTALLAFDLNSGALRKRIESPVPGLLGDMTISRNGDLYVSEGIHGAVLRLRAGANQLERLDVAGEFASPQTPALSADEKTLYVADYVRGIAAITLPTRAVRWLEPADGFALSGVDGLYVYRNSLIAVQNGTNPARIVRFSLDLQKQEILEANAPYLGQPTHGTLAADTFYFIANTGWDQYDDNGKRNAGAPPVVSTVRKMALK
ncbi:MAG TPA: hypothetical protein VFW44_03705 [Bryobacteraceae bacterium]|nr:hypothetical protein [Bryobacteraceae bacterium]